MQLLKTAAVLTLNRAVFVTKALHLLSAAILLQFPASVNKEITEVQKWPSSNASTRTPLARCLMTAKQITFVENHLL